MNKLLHLCRREVSNVKRRHERTRETDSLSIFIDWSRTEGQKDERLFTVIENVPIHILRQIETDTRKAWNPWHNTF